MKKRFWSGLAGILIIALLAAGCGQSSQATSSGQTGKTKTVELKFAHIMSPKHIQHVEVMEPFTKDVEKATEGRVKITIYPGAALAKPADEFNAAATGIADIAFGVQGYTPGKFPLTSVLSLPFQATSAENGSKIIWDLYNKFPEMQKEYAGTKVLYLWAGDTGQIITSKKQVRTLVDLKGLKLRSPDPQLNEVIKAWGATPVSMPMPDLYDAMQKGVVDGALTPLSAIADFNLADVSKYLTIANIYTSAFFVVMNPNAWSKISPDDQKKIDSLIGTPLVEKAAKAYDSSAKTGLALAKEKGMTVYTVPEDELSKWKQKAAGVDGAWIKEMDSKGLPGQKVYDEAKALVKKYVK